MKQLILLRHGQSLWNLEDRFTGWTDIDLSNKGRAEAVEAGRRLVTSGIMPDFCFTSYLRRAIHTLDIVLDNIGRSWLPVIKDWHLNERHYGALQGLNKADTARKVGQEQVHIWRRSYDVAPPALTPDDPRFPGNEPAYKDLAVDELPLTESLADTVRRVEICREELIVPALRHNGTVLIAAHGNSLRALAMKLLNFTPEEIVSVEIPTGSLWLFTLDDSLRVTSNRYI